MSEFKNKRLTKELLDELRSIDGFPIAEDEDILALSDPPFYTACPNPFIKAFIEKYGKPYDPKNDGYHREPFTADVSEGKNDPIYMAHSYPTKVPHKAIMRYILHYTEPGDIVFDGFCGTGMTGVAAHICGQPDKKFQKKIDKEMPYVKWGQRKAILCDLSTAATYLAYNFNTPIDENELDLEAQKILNEIKQKCNWIYETNHYFNNTLQNNIVELTGEKRHLKGTINFTFWSDVFACPGCSHEIIFWEVAVDRLRGKIKQDFNCPYCDLALTKRNLERVFETIIDEPFGKTIKRRKQLPVLLNYKVKVPSRARVAKRYEKTPDKDDLEIIKKIEDTKIPYWYPTNKFMFKGKQWGDTWRAGYHAGITHVHHFFPKKELWVLSALFSSIQKIKRVRIRNALTMPFTTMMLYCSYMRRFRPDKRGGGPLSGTLYISSLSTPLNPIISYPRNQRKITQAFQHFPKKFIPNIITTQSSTELSLIPDNSIDYIFTDPPFGSNLMYSELNFIWEAWLKVFTNNKKEAIVNKVQSKGLPEYQRLMEQCFKENCRILKPGRWMTVEFHNSQNRVWIAIQEALLRAGFVVADVRTLDKKQGTFKQVTTTSAVKQDLIISAYKPNDGLEENFKLKGGTEEGVWTFIRHHLKHLPVYVEKDGYVEVIAERQSFLLFDRMIAFHVQRGISVPISASEFYAGLKQRFPQRDDMYFTVDQVHDYDRKRMKAKRVEQVSLFVHDERSAIQWLRRELSREPQTYQDIQPKFLQELYKEKHEDLPELSEILEQNFLKDDEGRWYIPDSSREADLEKLREKTLLREFQDYKNIKGRLRMFRSEAVRTGFSKCWQEGDYGTIVEVAEKLPIRVLQEEPTLLMYYDNAVMRTQV